ncbi:ABC transporter permease [Sciscionella sediminilitoris]|uniref:ABC transporter permease n=1 Tax=Sciscionella sediminilitoris TaxID=1445613 RepID=UPI00068AE7C7|nr:ABC transporter permease [Sciscionella sp. SE31]
MSLGTVLGARAASGGQRRIRIGVLIVGLFVLLALAAPVITPYEPNKLDVFHILEAPSWAHWLGTDELGRDVLTRMVFAARVDLLIGFLGACLPAVLGTALGALAGYLGGWVDAVIMRASDVVQAFPTYILIIALVFALGQGPVSILVSFTVVAWVAYARLVRTEVLRIRELEFVQAAHTAGLSRTRVLWRHVTPNSLGQALVYLPSDIVVATLGLASLSFLGLGIEPPTAEWGAMIAAGKPYIQEQWWLATVPGLVVLVFGLGLSMIADGMESRLRT